MKRWIKTIISIFVLGLVLLMPAVKAQAGNITSVTVTPGTKQITVKGVADNDVLSVVIFVYDSTGTNLIQMESVAVDANHAYTRTFTVENGSYLIKVADYDGGAFKTANVTVGAPGTEKYTVSVTSGDKGTAVASLTEAEAGTTITITAAPDSGYAFKGWTVESGEITLSDSTKEETTFVMPAANVRIKAVFEKAISEGEEQSITSEESENALDASKTGDNNRILLWLTGLIVSAAVIVGISLSKIKKTNK